MAGVPAEPLRSHGVQVSETWYPVKQVLERTTGADRSDVISTAARRQLKKLGFPVRPMSRVRSSSVGLSVRGGTASRRLRIWWLRFRPY